VPAASQRSRRKIAFAGSASPDAARAARRIYGASPIFASAIASAFVKASADTSANARLQTRAPSGVHTIEARSADMAPNPSAQPRLLQYVWRPAILLYALTKAFVLAINRKMHFVSLHFFSRH
jgi:hypothetical protein